MITIDNEILTVIKNYYNVSITDNNMIFYSALTGKKLTIKTKEK